jgi:hypothetical protein
MNGENRFPSRLERYDAPRVYRLVLCRMGSLPSGQKTAWKRLNSG